MNTMLREMQLNVLDVFSKATKTFALAGGTALELFYLKHRFSKDLDFFSPKYNIGEIENIILDLKKKLNLQIKFENEFIAAGHAKVRFYTIGSKKPDIKLKIDFVEDVFFKKPVVKKFNNIPVYDVKNIYAQKIFAIAGTYTMEDGFGKQIATGRNEARDVFDVYMLSKQIKPLHIFIKNLPRGQQRGMVQWWRSFSRLDLKIGVMDLDIYQKKFNSLDMLNHIDNEIKKFIGGEIEI
ncbi:MAG: hypothetical protein A2539_01005 [Elusimicrobia bacterium RIFOXYD2_FULL_34_15]|nr:MAG: hypothetical protein A2539_01005 [Elusimicrobia bacterium RIFOXYD2_FULL_34_15]